MSRLDAGPCMCGDPWCPSCGSAMGTYGAPAEREESDDLEAMLDTIEAHEDEITDEERELVDQCQARLGDRAQLHDWQEDKLRVIYNRINHVAD